MLNRKFSKEDLEKMDLHDYLASSSDEEGLLLQDDGLGTVYKVQCLKKGNH